MTSQEKLTNFDSSSSTDPDTTTGEVQEPATPDIDDASPGGGATSESVSEADANPDSDPDPSAEDDSRQSVRGGFGSGRRKKLAALEDADTLKAVDEIMSLDELIDAIRDIDLQREDDYYVYRVDERVIETLKRTYQNLPEDARKHFVGDGTLRKRINAARSQRNDWVSKQTRLAQMPGWAEAGPANYPKKKFERRRDSAHGARDELDEALDQVRARGSSDGGARQEALEAINSSVAEQNEQSAKSKRERMRDQLHEGAIVRFRDPQLCLGAVVRVNKKSVRVSRPNPRAGSTKPLSDEPEPDFIESRVDLDSEYLTHITPDNLAPLDPDDFRGVDKIPEDYRSAQEMFLEDPPTTE